MAKPEPVFACICGPIWLLFLGWASLALVQDFALTSLDCWPALEETTELENVLSDSTSNCYCDGLDVVRCVSTSTQLMSRKADATRAEFPECERALLGRFWNPTTTTCTSETLVVIPRLAAVESRSHFILQWYSWFLLPPFGIPLYFVFGSLGATALERLAQARKALRPTQDYRGGDQLQVTAFPPALCLGHSSIFPGPGQVGEEERRKMDADLAFAVASNQVNYHHHTQPLGPLLSHHPLFPLLARRILDVSGYEPGYKFRTESILASAMIDRSRTIPSDVNLEFLEPIPAFNQKFHLRLTDLIEQTVDRILKAANDDIREIWIMWEQDVNSTLAVTALLKRAEQESLRQKIVVVYTEHNNWHDNHFFRTKINTLQGRGPKFGTMAKSEALLGGHLVADMKNRSDVLLVTGHLGDQIFGSPLIPLVFSSSLPFGGRNSMHHALNEPWEAVMKRQMEDSNAVQNGADWVEWISPMVAQSPIPIVCLFDFLWWLSFCCSWQSAAMQVFMEVPPDTQSDTYDANKGGSGVDSQSVQVDLPTNVPAEVRQRVFHFFDHTSWQQWSYHNHQDKFPTRERLATYKLPLKDYILQFSGDTSWHTQHEEAYKAPAFNYNFGLTAAGDLIRFGMFGTNADIANQRYRANGSLEAACLPLRPVDVSDRGSRGPAAFWRRFG